MHIMIYLNWIIYLSTCPGPTLQQMNYSQDNSTSQPSHRSVHCLKQPIRDQYYLVSTNQRRVFTIDAKEEEDRSSTISLSERTVKSLVSVLRAAPDLILYTPVNINQSEMSITTPCGVSTSQRQVLPVNVILTIAFQHKEACVLGIHIKIFWVVIVHWFQLI